PRRLSVAACLAASRFFHPAAIRLRIFCSSISHRNFTLSLRPWPQPCGFGYDPLPFVTPLGVLRALLSRKVSDLAYSNPAVRLSFRLRVPAGGRLSKSVKFRSFWFSAFGTAYG